VETVLEAVPQPGRISSRKFCRAPYGTDKDKFNRVTFDAVETTAIRLEVRLSEGFSGGILEWRVE
jgi:hypothetical protein